MRRLIPYVYEPLGIQHRPTAGRLALALTAEVDSDAQEVRKATLAGTVSVEGEALLRVGRPDPFLSASRLAVEVKEADILARTLTVGRLAFEGLDAKVRRDARGVIDVVEIFTARGGSSPSPGGTAPAPPPRPTSPSPPAPPGSPPGPTASTAPPRRTLFPVIQGLAAGFHQIHVEQATLTPSRVLWVDERTRPTTRLALANLQARVDGFTWPVRGPAALVLSTELPGGGRLDAKGPMTVSPFDVELALSIRDAPVAPYQGYIPIPARLSGRYSGDSKNRVAVRDGVLVAQSKGRSWAQDVEIREPGVDRPAIRVERMELTGIDFDWPRRATVAGAASGAPAWRWSAPRTGRSTCAGCSRLAEEATDAVPDGARAGARAAPAAPEPKGLLETMRLEFGKVRIEDGFDPLPGPDHPARLLAGPVAARADAHRLRQPARPARHARAPERRGRGRGSRHPGRDRAARRARPTSTWSGSCGTSSCPASIPTRPPTSAG